MDEEVPPANEPEINAELLEVLGKEITSDKKLLGPALQKEVATRWIGIAKWGLGEEERKSLIELYPGPENCPLAAPKLNLEVKAAINESVLRRDMRMVKIQNQIGASLSAIGHVITLMLKKEGGEHLTYIKQLSDASRLLLDLHHQETDTRRDLASLNLNKELKDTLINEPADEWFFGAALDERVRTTRTLEKSGQELKAPRSKVVVKRPNTTRQSNFVYLDSNWEFVKVDAINRRLPAINHKLHAIRCRHPAIDINIITETRRGAKELFVGGRGHTHVRKRGG